MFVRIGWQVQSQTLNYHHSNSIALDVICDTPKPMSLGALGLKRGLLGGSRMLMHVNNV